ncbi:hypothetical protein B5X24_HaOG211627 [Helicoverpa armigera]|uniref:Transmembrane protein 181 n=1 Tax=Helicoverpa armigera TaxID=29058 RepID=A0A2W1BF27_HELAM|nr:hypothetical protein B5X24_HaOG211627 [Helicoverpa armigera]
MDTANVGYSYHLPSGGWNYKIRNTLSQFSDLFSEFNKYIAPAYHHDRCERSVQMRIYSMHKGEFVMVFIAFFACFGLGVFIGLAGPSPTMTTSIPASSVLTNASSIYQGPFHLHSKALGLRAQQLWLMAEILTNNDDEEIFDKSFQVSISIEGVLADHTTEDILSEADAPNRTQHLKCKKRACDEVMILHILWLDYTHYVFNVNFFGLKEFHHRYFIRDIIFYFKTYNPAFTQMETWFRFIFVMTSFFMTFWFAYMMRKYPMTDWSIEQRWIYILLPLLLTFNGSINRPDTHRNDRGIVSFYLFKYVVVIMCGIPAIVLGNWQKFNSYLDPTFNYMMDPDYPLVKLWFFCAITIYFLYLLILIIKAYSDLRNMPFFDIRLRCLSIVVGTVTSIITILALQGWGPAALQDHWACQPKVHFDTSAPFMALYGLFNFYIYILAYLFSPGGGNIHETAITKDNPAFSMINDSDEEVIYGSDEESRRPLNSHHRITTDEDL